MTPTANSLYLREIASYELLTPDDEIELAKRIEVGCEDARALLIKHNLRLVVRIARGYSIPTMPLADLIAEGNIGLMKAVERFDWRRGFRFAGTACPWIKSAIAKAITAKSRLVRLPTNAVIDLRREGDIDGVLSYVPAPLGTGNEIEGEDAEDQIYSDQLPAVREGLSNAMSCLSEQERHIVELRFGLREPCVSLRAAGGRLGMTHENVRKIERRALGKLRLSAEAQSVLAALR